MMNQLAKLRKCISRVHFDKYNLKKYMEVLEMLPHLKMIESKGRCALTPGPSLPPGGSQPSQHLRSQLRPFQPAPLHHCIALHSNTCTIAMQHLRHCITCAIAPLQHLHHCNATLAQQRSHLAVKGGMSCIATVFADNVRGDVLPLWALPCLVAGGRAVLTPAFQNVRS